MKAFVLSLALLVLGTVGTYAECTGQFPAGYLCGNDAATQATPHAIPAPPPKAGSNLTFAVATTGNDSNPCTTLLPCLTIQRGVNAMAVYDYQGLYFPTLNVAHGAYVITAQIQLPPLIHLPQITFAQIIGDTTTPTNVIVQNTTSGSDVFYAFNQGSLWAVKGFETDCSAAAYTADYSAAMLVGSAAFADSSNSGAMIAFQALQTGIFYDDGTPMTVVASTMSAFAVANNYAGMLLTSPYTLPGTLTIANTFLNSTTWSEIANEGATFTSSTITGVSYNLSVYSLIVWPSAPSTIPGNGTGLIDPTSTFGDTTLTGPSPTFFAGPISGAPTTSDLDPGAWGIFKDTTQPTGQGISAYVNDAGTMVAVGKLGDATGSTTVAGFGTNSPAVTGTAPYTWLKFLSSDGSTVWVPAYK
jgi:hypothetical protein